MGLFPTKSIVRIALGNAFVSVGLLASVGFAAPLRINGNTVCTDTTWHDVLVFLLANFVAHVATLPQNPGVKWYISLQWSIVALFLPFTALTATIWKLLAHFQYGGTELQNAAAAGALLHVSRTADWKLDSKIMTEIQVSKKEFNKWKIRDKMPNLQFLSNLEYDYSKHFNIHGSHTLPPGYALEPSDLQIQSSYIFGHLEGHGKHVVVSRSCSWVKMMAGLAQLIFACITLYNASKSQLGVYGYASFGLYVFPFALMSVVNLVCIGIIGDYSHLYVVRTPVLLEAERRGGVFDGSIGTLSLTYDPMWPSNKLVFDSEPPIIVTAGLENGHPVMVLPDDPETTSKIVFNIGTGASKNALHLASYSNDYSHMRKEFSSSSLCIAWAALVLILTAPYIFIAGFTRFHAQKSISSERGWLISWIVCNQISIFLPGSFGLLRTEAGGELLAVPPLAIVFYLMVVPLSVPAIGAYCTIIRQMLEFGTCTAV